MYVIVEMYRRPTRCLTKTQAESLRFAGASKKTIQSVVEGFGLFRIDAMGHVFSNIDFFNQENDTECDPPCVPPHDPPHAPGALPLASVAFPTPVRTCNHDDDDNTKLIINLNNHHQHHQQDACEGEDFIAKIPQHSQWTEVALMKSGFGPLIQRNWQLTLDAFRTHTIVNCSTENIRNLPDDAPPRPNDRVDWDFENQCWN